MQKTSKRMLSVLLSMVMATTILVGLPAAKAFAAWPDLEIDNEKEVIAGFSANDGSITLVAAPVCQIVGGSQYTTLEAAVDAAASGDTILLLAHINEASAIDINSELIIDMAGYNINLNTGFFSISDTGSLIVKGGGILTANGVGATGAGSSLSIDVEELVLEMGVSGFSGATITITGNITACINDGVSAWGAGTEVTINGSIEAAFGVSVGGGAKVTVNGDITAEITGVSAGEYGTETTVNGNIISEDVGIYAWDGVKITVNGEIDAGHMGVLAYNDGTEIVINGNTVVAEERDENDGSLYCGVFVAFGAKVTVNGTVTAPNYIGFFIPSAEELDSWLYFLDINDNTTPSALTGYLQYDDEGKYDMLASFVWIKEITAITPVTGDSDWVKEITTTVPGTGDGTALALLLGALMVTALGIGSVFAYRRSRQEP